MQTKRQLKRCTRNVHPSFADFRPGFGVNFHILLTQNWLWESSLSLLSLWCILFQIKLCLFRENLNLKKHLGTKNGWSSPSTFWHRLIYIMIYNLNFVHQDKPCQVFYLLWISPLWFCQNYCSTGHLLFSCKINNMRTGVCCRLANMLNCKSCC